MKKIRLILETYRQNVVPSILVLVIMTISLLVMTVSLGQYRLSTYTFDLLAHAGLENADYLMQAISGPDSLDETYTQQLIEKIGSYKLVDEVLKAQFAITQYENVRHVIMLYDAPMQKAFPLRVARGKWLPDSERDAQALPAVIGGSQEATAKVGEEILLTIDGKQPIQLAVRVCGSLGPYAYTPDFNSSGTADVLNASYFFSQGDQFIIPVTEVLMDQLKQNNSIISDPYFIVRYRDNVTQEEKEAFRQEISEYGSTAPMSQIMETTRSQIYQQAKEILPFPIFLMVISTVMLLSVSVLLTFQKINQYAVYSLCGCSRRNILFYTSAGIAIIGLTALSATILMVTGYSFLNARRILDFGEVWFDAYSILTAVIYIGLLILISQGMIYSVLRKNSPIEMYRRME
ncbi:MAG: ABC transporter permease [Clostridiales bacterium]|nr:ABC transporter permease [Clostridiales bacterium]